jgi:hypothetical protein
MPDDKDHLLNSPKSDNFVRRAVKNTHGQERETSRNHKKNPHRGHDNFVRVPVKKIYNFFIGELGIVITEKSVPSMQFNNKGAHHEEIFRRRITRD